MSIKARSINKEVICNRDKLGGGELLNIHTIIRNQRSNCQHLLDHRKSKGVLEKHLLLLY